MIGHATWEGRTVQPGEHVFLEVGGCYRRYHTAMMRTVLLGDMTASLLQAQERMKLALREVKNIIRPGLTVSDADNLIRAIIQDNQVGANLITRSGYSIGIAFPPSWDEGYICSLRQGSSTILEEGMCFHIIPWMWGVDGDKTVGISDTIHVTDKSCQSFFTLDEDFVVKGEQALVGKRVGASETLIAIPQHADPEKSHSGKSGAKKSGPKDARTRAPSDQSDKAS
jgi:Xaa-Pro dipeptidase